MDIKDVQRRLANGLSHWLQFEFDCLRGYLFSEKYLALPVGQLLLASCNQPIRAEVDHPVLVSDGGPGRPMQLDFIVGNADRPLLVVETKWLGESRVRPSEILWDLVRLELAAHHWQCEALFVLAGLQKKIVKLLSSAAFSYKSRNGRTRTILPVKDASRRAIQVHTAASNHLKRVSEEMARFPNVKVPLRMTSDHPYWYPKSAGNLSFGAWVWRISPNVNRKTGFLAHGTA